MDKDVVKESNLSLAEIMFLAGVFQSFTKWFRAKYLTKSEVQYWLGTLGWSAAVFLVVVMVLLLVVVTLPLISIWNLYIEGYRTPPGNLMLTYTAAEWLWLPTFIGIFLLLKQF